MHIGSSPTFGTKSQMSTKTLRVLVLLIFMAIFILWLSLLKTTPTNDKIVAVGGSVAGLAAAIVAVRNGATILIIERFPYFGGTATASLMANIVGFRNQVEPDGIQTTKGIGEEIILELLKINGARHRNWSKPE